jgi:hypothetical protein
MDWVTNKTAFDAVTLLSEHNHLFHRVGETIIGSHPTLVPGKDTHVFNYGVKQNLLFGINGTLSFPRFRKSGKRFSGNKQLSFNNIEYKLSHTDINQLEELNCNHKYVSGPNRGTPYKASEPFKLSPHKFRHSFAWLVVATKLGDIDDIKYQFKHLGVAMTHIYTNRAHENFSSLIEVINVFDDTAQKLVQEAIIRGVQANQVAGLGGETIVQSFLRDLNRDETDQFNLDAQAHIKSADAVMALLNKHGGNITFLTNGVCVRGASCKSINKLNDCGSTHCPTFIATTKNLPYWQTVMRNAETQRNSILSKTPEEQAQYKNLLASANKTLNEASKVIEQLTTGASLKERSENK